MDLLLGLLKQLSATLTPSEFLMVLFAVAGGIFFVVKMIVKNAKGSISLLSILTGDTMGKKSSSDELMRHQLEDVASKGELKDAEARVIILIEQMRENIRKNNVDINEQLKMLSVLKIEVENSFENSEKQLDTLQHLSKMHDMHIETSFKALSDIVLRGQDMIASTLSRVDKVDEFVRTAVPEFRGHHKELTKDIAQISKEVAVMDRVLQAQINTSKEGITLR